MEELEKYLRAMLLLDIWNAQQTAERSGSVGPKFELLLADAGFGTKEIADLLSKSPAAVAKAISRAKASRRGTQMNDNSDSGEGQNV